MGSLYPLYRIHTCNTMGQYHGSYSYHLSNTMAHLQLTVVPSLNAGQPLTIINMGFISSLNKYNYDSTLLHK